MEILKIILMIIFAIDCIALTAIVLMQEGKSAGLGTISGVADTYWGQNKGRSMEGALEVPCSPVYCTGSSVEFEGICVREGIFMRTLGHSCVGVSISIYRYFRTLTNREG